MSKGRYRAVEVAMWGHHRFRYMSRPEPCGQFLWLYLLTNPDTGMIPGIYRGGEATLAESLGWELGPPVSKDYREALRKAFREAIPAPKPKTFREALAEVEEQGLVVIDSDARIVWIPGAIEHNRPQSAKVVKGWARDWKELPDCPMKAEAWETLRDFISKGYGEGYQKAFREACPKPFSKATRKPIPKLSDEREKREERRDLDQIPPSPLSSERYSKPKNKGKKRELSEEAEAVRAEISKLRGIEYPPATFDALETRLRAKDLTLDDALVIVRYAASDPFWSDEVKLDPSTLFRPKHWPGLLGKARAKPATHHPPPRRGIDPEEHRRVMDVYGSLR